MQTLQPGEGVSDAEMAAGVVGGAVALIGAVAVTAEVINENYGVAAGIIAIAGIGVAIYKHFRNHEQ